MKTQRMILSVLLLAGLLMLPLPASRASQALGTVFDFTANAAYASWQSGAGTLPFPGTSGDARGMAQLDSAPVLEDGTVAAPGLLMVPQDRYNGYLQGIYPEFLVQKGDRFQTIVNCAYGATGCYVTFRLDILTAGGAPRILWQWKEKHEGRYYAADLDLSALAGQKVRFVLTLLATGSASGDRALWVAPRLVRPGNGQTPLPSITPTSTPFSTPPPVTPTSCNRAALVSDLTVRDGTTFAPGAAFTKSWRLKNIGNCTWTKSYALLFYSGEQMSAPTVVTLPWSVAPGQTVDLAVDAVAPLTAGTHRSEWILRSASGALFGAGAIGASPIWLQINVTGSAPASGSGYDFVTNVCAAQWQSGAGVLPCPAASADTRGFALAQSLPALEDGSTSASGLLTVPQNKLNGYIQGIYPAFTVQPGDRFQALVGCEAQASCYVTLRLEYLTPGGAPRIFWQWKEKNDGHTYRVNLDLTSLAGQSLRFVLTTLASGSPIGDRAVWAEPRIVRPGLPVTATAQPSTTGWNTFSNPAYGFQFKTPPGTILNSQSNTAAQLTLPMLSTGTNLTSKTLDLKVVEGLSTCSVALTHGAPGGISQTQNISLNGLNFVKVEGTERGAGQIYQYTAYSTAKGNACLTLMFILRSGQPGFYDPPRPVFDTLLETAIISQVLGTFSWPALAQTSVAQGPYAVFLVPSGGTLIAYAAAGANNPTTAELSSSRKDLYFGNSLNLADGSRWVELRLDDGSSGWVDFQSLTESVTPEQFVADPRPVARIEQLKQAVNAADGELLATLVSPRHGLRISYHGSFGPGLVFMPAQVRGLFSSTESLSWGTRGASGLEAVGTFSDIIRPDLLATLNAAYQLHANDPLHARMYLEPWPGIYQNIPYFAVLKPAATEDSLDWRIWLAGFEYVDGTPYLVSLIQYIWEP